MGEPMNWISTDDATTRSGDYVLDRRQDRLFYLMCQYRNLGRFQRLADGQKAAEVHAAIVAGVDEAFYRLVGFLRGEAPQ